MPARRFLRVFAAALVLAAVSRSPAGTRTNSVVETAPVTPREFFNAGTQKLREGKLREAEAFLQSALAGQDERLQPPALYNLGWVRFNQGLEELKKGPAAGPAAARAWSAAQQGGDALRQADAALANDDVQLMVAAYLRGRGVRRELASATEAVQQAMDLYGATLAKWRRASGDFKSAAELDPGDTPARHNADVADRCIAKLVDRLRDMQQACTAACERGTRINDQLQKLKGRIPDDQVPGEARNGEGEEFPFVPRAGQQEGPSREGEETSLSPEQAGWLLEGFKLGGDRRLPMAQGDTTTPRDRLKPTW